ELLPPKTVDRKAQQMRLVLLAGPHTGIAAGVCRGRADAAARPFGRLVARVPPALVVVGNRPSTVEISPDRRIRVRQGLGANFRDKRWTQAGQVAPVSLRPALAAVQVLVTSARQDRTRWIQLEHAHGRVRVQSGSHVSGWVVEWLGTRVCPA